MSSTAATAPAHVAAESSSSAAGGGGASVLVAAAPAVSLSVEQSNKVEKRIKKDLKAGGEDRRIVKEGVLGAGRGVTRRYFQGGASAVSAGSVLTIIHDNNKPHS